MVDTLGSSNTDGHSRPKSSTVARPTPISFLLDRICSIISFPDAEHGFAIGKRTFGGQFVLYSTESGGAEWEVRYHSLNQKMIVYQMEFVNAWHGFGIGYQSILETHDGGRSWYPRNDVGGQGTLSPKDALPLNDSKLLAANPKGDISFPDDQYGWIVRNGVNGPRTVLKTTDAGETWTLSLSDGVGGYNSLFFLDRERGWMCTSSGRIDSTTDGGETWNLQLQLPGADNALSSIYFVNEYSGWAVGEAGRILSTTDGGETWNEDILDASWDWVAFTSPLASRAGSPAQTRFFPLSATPLSSKQTMLSSRPAIVCLWRVYETSSSSSTRRIPSTSGRWVASARGSNTSRPLRRPEHHNAFRAWWKSRASLFLPAGERERSA